MILIYRRIILIMFSILLAACEDDASPALNDIEKQPLIRLGMAMQPSSALLIIADKKGFFQQQGLQVAITPYPSGKRALHEGLLNDEVDIIGLNESPFVMAAFKHKDLRTFSHIFIDDNTNAIVTRRDLGVQFPADLKGKKIATQEASAVHYFLHQFLIENNIAFDQIEINFYKAETLVSKLMKGKIDAFSMREPYISEAKKFLKDNVVVFEEEGIYTQIGLLVANETYLLNNRRASKNFLRALLQAEDYFLKHRQEGLKIVAVYLGTDFTTFTDGFGQAEVRLGIDQLYINVSEEIARWAINKGYVDKKEMPNFLQRVMPEPLREIAPDSVTLIDEQE